MNRPTRTLARTAAVLGLVLTGATALATAAGAAGPPDPQEGVKCRQLNIVDDVRVDVDCDLDPGTGIVDVLVYNVPDPGNWTKQNLIGSATFDTASGDTGTGPLTWTLEPGTCTQVDVVKRGSDQPAGADVDRDCAPATPAPTTTTPAPTPTSAPTLSPAPVLDGSATSVAQATTAPVLTASSAATLPTTGAHTGPAAALGIAMVVGGLGAVAAAKRQ